MGGRTCKKCDQPSQHPVEKHTDVNLATDMIVGAHEDRYDQAMLISADADQVAAVRAVRGLGKYVTVVYPPKRESTHLTGC